MWSYSIYGFGYANNKSKLALEIDFVFQGDEAHLMLDMPNKHFGSGVL